MTALSSKLTRGTVPLSNLPERTDWVDNSVMGATVDNGSTISYANYQVTKDSNGVYWLEWNMRTNDAGTSFTHVVTLTNLGTTFVGGSFQHAAVYDQAANGCTMNDGTNTFSVSFSGSSKTNFTAYGKGRLAGKPSWFDANREAGFSINAQVEAALATTIL